MRLIDIDEKDKIDFSVVIYHLSPCGGGNTI